MAKLFLSYSRMNFYAAANAEKMLVFKGHDVYFDIRKLEPGANWESEIKSAIVNADMLIVFVSKYSIDSQYVLAEIKYAIENGVNVIFMRLDNTKIHQYSNFYYVEARDGLSKGIERLIRLEKIHENNFDSHFPNHEKVLFLPFPKPVLYIFVLFLFSGIWRLRFLYCARSFFPFPKQEVFWGLLAIVLSLVPSIWDIWIVKTFIKRTYPLHKIALLVFPSIFIMILYVLFVGLLLEDIYYNIGHCYKYLVTGVNLLVYFLVGTFSFFVGYKDEILQIISLDLTHFIMNLYNNNFVIDFESYYLTYESL